MNNKKNDGRKDIDLANNIKYVKNAFTNNVYIFTNPVRIEEFANTIHKSASDIIKYFFLKGRVFNLNSMLDEDAAMEICLEYRIDFQKKKAVNENNILANIQINDDPAELTKRAPIITIMGHVDHGKTTLLDYIRKSNVVKSEHGGITQHIGAYQITFNNELLTFIDTPGHEAFNAMRERGANCTDIVVIVVAADDGIKPQTVESIKVAKAAKVPILVFINKMDKPNINVEQVMNQLADRGLLAEEWGGDTLTVKGSALTGANVDHLLEAILTIAEVAELKANQNRLATGVVLESSVEKGLGTVATLLIKNGTLKVGDFVIAGGAVGNVKIIFNDQLKTIKSAIPSQPVKVVGLNALPVAGEYFLVSNDKTKIKELAKNINIYRTNEDLSNRVAINNDPNVKNLNLILKTDFHGSLEAIKALCENIKIENTSLNIVRASVGTINESDVNLAKSTKSLVVGFNIKPTKTISDIAQQNDVKILFYNIIYKLNDDIINMLVDQLAPITVEKTLGEARIQQLWQHTDVGVIAGCLAIDGEINRNDRARVLRNGVVLHDTKIGSMKHFKDTINKITKGMEFGIVLENIKDLQVGDIIQCYRQEQQKATGVSNEQA